MKKTLILLMIIFSFNIAEARKPFDPFNKYNYKKKQDYDYELQGEDFKIGSNSQSTRFKIGNSGKEEIIIRNSKYNGSIKIKSSFGNFL